MVAILVSIFLNVGCGSSSTAPSSSLSLGGSWNGTFQYVTGGVTVTDTVTATIIQSTSAIGQWAAASGATGTFSFPPAATASGAFTISQPNIGSAACAGTSTMAGTAATSAVVFTVADITKTATCPWATQMTMTLQR